MLRRPILIALAAGTLAFAAAGCGGEESAVCEDLENVQSSIQDLRDVELGEEALEEIQHAADEIGEEVRAAQADAEAELGDELAGFETSVQALAAEVEAAVADGLSGESLQALSAAISGVASSFQALQDAASDCDL